ncbi:hypothetical protein [Candidatus Methylocalor cossyra]|uniref:Uncharacterized protein n=1 Tax=Candidatus Methylocalor cossyra TaxID=3108543 RepID=A0ABM9NF16_9GAMM
MDGPGLHSKKFGIGTRVIYKPKHPSIDNARYVGQQAVVVRYLRSGTRRTLPDESDYFIEFPSRVVLLVAENDLEPA